MVFEGRRRGSPTVRPWSGWPGDTATAAGRPAEAEGDAFTAPFSAPSAGPPPWHLYYVTVRTAFGVASAEPHGATRRRFG